MEISSGALPNPGDPLSDGPKPRWRRILLKLSGEAFAGEAGYGIDGKVVQRIADDILAVKDELDIEMRSSSAAATSGVA